MHYKYWIISATLVLLVYGCNKHFKDGFTRFKNPSHFPAPVYHFSSNPVTREGFELGRKLFYEPRLSRNNSISCGTCHIQSAAFTHHGHDVSHGIDDRLGNRNSPPIMNLAWNTHFFWDGGVFDLDLQPIVPITNHVEMDESVDNVLNKLRAHPDYPKLFKKVFGTAEINSARMMQALSQFMLQCVSTGSKYDSLRQQKGATFTPSERAGYAFFQQHCNSCHAEPLFTDNSFRNNGIGAGPNKDEGRYLITLQQTDRYKFKVPSLRNVAHTAPYMHDGRFLTLSAVLDHYRKGVQRTPNLDPLLQQESSPGIAMTDSEKNQLIAFLQTLTDKNFLTNKQLAEQ